MQLPISRFEDFRNPSGEIEAMERFSIVEKELKELSDSHQGVLQMRYEKGVTFVEIGTALNISSDGVKMLWDRAIEKPKAHLSQHGDLSSTKRF